MTRDRATYTCFPIALLPPEVFGIVAPCSVVDQSARLTRPARRACMRYRTLIRYLHHGGERMARSVGSVSMDDLVGLLEAGRMSRREFVSSGIALGLSLGSGLGPLCAWGAGAHAAT